MAAGRRWCSPARADLWILCSICWTTAVPTSTLRRWDWGAGEWDGKTIDGVRNLALVLVERDINLHWQTSCRALNWRRINATCMFVTVHTLDGCGADLNAMQVTVRQWEGGGRRGIWAMDGVPHSISTPHPPTPPPPSTPCIVTAREIQRRLSVLYADITLPPPPPPTLSTSTTCV